MREYKKPVFSQKHYEIVAKFIWDGDWISQVEYNFFIDFAKLFVRDNPKFSTKRFLSACGYKPPNRRSL